MQETQVWCLCREDPLEKEMATHSSILAWKIPRTEDPGGLQSVGSQRVTHSWANQQQQQSFQQQSCSLETHFVRFSPNGNKLVIFFAIFELIEIVQCEALATVSCNCDEKEKKALRTARKMRALQPPGGISHHSANRDFMKTPGKKVSQPLPDDHPGLSESSQEMKRIQWRSQPDRIKD